MVLTKSYIINYTKTLLELDVSSYLITKFEVVNNSTEPYKINILINDKFLLSHIPIPVKQPNELNSIFKRKLGLGSSDRLEVEAFQGNGNFLGFIEAQETTRKLLSAQSSIRKFLATQAKKKSNNTDTPIEVILHYIKQ